MTTAAFCEFFNYGDSNYECVVTSLKITRPGIKVTQFNSDLLGLKKLVIRDQDIHYFPQGIPDLFPNLQELEISNCKLKVIEANDLRGFDKLKILNLAKNCLQYLPDDLFSHVPQLERAYFNENNINLKLLEPLRSHQCIDLKGNKINLVL